MSKVEQEEQTNPKPWLKGLIDCTSCTARNEAKQPVGAFGSIRKEGIMAIGRNPGADEDEVQEPFVGKSGEFLNKYLESCNIQRGDVYISNTIKCHTCRNREPDILEIKMCTDKWLHKEMIYLQPKLIFILGADAFRGVFNHNISRWIDNTGVIRDMRKEFGFQAVILPHPSAVISYHPDWKQKYIDTVEGVKAIIKQEGL
jgi:uracil-DNA glycosylase family 4